MEDWSHSNARAYLQERFKDPEAFRTQWPLQCFHEFYTKYHNEWDTTRARLLEFGGGPTIYGLISASPHVSEIVFSDYVEENRQEVKNWKDGSPQAFDWAPFFKYVVQKLEGDATPDAAIRRESELRSRMVSVIPCDVHLADPVGTPAPSPFDIVSTIYCLTAGCSSQAEVREAFQKLGKLVKPGGFMIVMDALELTWASVAGERIKCVSVTKQFLSTAMEDAGFAVLETHHYELPERYRNAHFNNTGCECLIAKKIPT